MVHENVTNCFGTACNRAKSIIKNPASIYRFLSMSVLICSRELLQLITLADIRAINAKLKFTPVTFFDVKRYVVSIVTKSKLFMTIINLFRNQRAIETTRRLWTDRSRKTCGSPNMP